MNYFAIDLGATSGRTMLCRIDDGKISIEEVSRFSNPIIEVRNHCYWDILHLYNEIISGLATVARQGIEIDSIGIDTWGVDFVCFGSDGDILSAPLSYRDPHTAGIPAEFFKEIPASRVYGKTGIQVMDFNSLFQLYAMHKAGNSALAAADKILFMPDALSYLLTGVMVTEYSIASTSQLLNPVTKELDDELLRAVGVRPEQFAPIVMPGTRIGVLTKEVRRLTGLGAVSRCIFESLALRYRQVMEILDGFASMPIECLHIIGGGSQNAILNQFTCDSIGRQVLAGPAECTALGNAAMQARAAGEASSLAEMRALVAASVQPVEYTPTAQREPWDSAYRRFLEITTNDNN